MRDTDYATELVTATFAWGDSEARIERLLIKESQQEEIRFSWWKDGRLVMRPLDLTEDDLISLFRDAVERGVFTQPFRKALRQILSE